SLKTSIKTITNLSDTNCLEIQGASLKAWQEFDENGRMKPSSWYDRIVDVAEELFKITLLLKGQTSYLADRYSERKESHQELSSRVNQDKI
ncbi:hypothetical protein RZR71_14690, partial [Citrobacter freundii]|nr:hypothetical protein [Citrobacter freundii]MEB0315256.1 hypothetical protein [Citrobacter freundii]MEB0381807.1 hypothetical protein [Citrobacter freundii]